MKKFLAILLLVVVILSCVACDSSEEEITPELELAMKQAYLDNITVNKSLTVDDLSLTHCGCYDGAYVFFLKIGEMGLESIGTMGIGGLIFYVNDGVRPYAYKDGEIKSLGKAYKDGWISDKSLALLHARLYPQ